MNANIFRLIFSKRLGMLVPVAEQTSVHHKGRASGGQPGCSAGGKRATFLLKSLAFSVALALSAPGFALPTDPTVVNGSASFNQNGSTLTVTNSPGAIIDWQRFSIAAGETTRFVQASASSAVMNRVVSNDPSAIYGTLSSNGKVWLVNQAGILIGAGAVIDTAGFVASTLAVRAEDFLAGRLAFQDTAGAGSVVNKGEIRTPSGGSVYLVGPSVTNEGIINAPNGEIILAAGQTVELIDTGTPGVKVAVTGADGSATNLGSIVAEAGRIGIAGVIVRNSGTLDASSVVSEGGRVFLKASQDTYVDGNGRIVATGTKGGSVEVLGERVAVMDNASIDASGATGGGTILVGGDYQGKNPDVQNATITYFGRDATLKANATDNGDGGKVIVWADDSARAYGSIEARGGANGGDGGFVETSGHRYLDFNARVDTRAPQGETGMLLLDPTDITISSSASTTGGIFDPPGIFVPGGATSTIYGGDIGAQLYSTDVTISTSSSYGGSGNITLSSASIYSSSMTPRTLTLNADQDIVIDGASSINGYYSLNVNMTAGRGIYTQNSGSLSVGSGNLDFVAQSVFINGGGFSASGNITGTITGNMTLDNNASLYASNKVDLTFSSGTSVISLNNNSSIETGIPQTIYLHFDGRSSGGVMIDGVETTTSPGLLGSGFFYNFSPAILGTNLIITYGVADTRLATLLDEASSSGETLPLVEIFGESNELLADQTIGGGEDEFGEGQVVAERERDTGEIDLFKKLGRKKAAQCRG